MTRKLILETKGPTSIPGSAPDDATYQLYENVGATPEIYIDGMQGLNVINTIVKINCFTRGAALPAIEKGAVEERQVACRLVMGTDTFLSVADWMQRAAAELKAQGAIQVQGNGKVS